MIRVQFEVRNEIKAGIVWHCSRVPYAVLALGIFHEGQIETVAKKLSEPAATFGPVRVVATKWG